MRDERYGHRDLTYSQWHRRLDDMITYIDIDGCEYCKECYEPLALIETAIDIGQSYKATGVLRKLAMKAGVPGYLVLYKIRKRMGGEAIDGVAMEIEAFRWRRVTPPETGFATCSPQCYARWLLKLHQAHRCNAQQGRLDEQR